VPVSTRDETAAEDKLGSSIKDIDQWGAVNDSNI
jgi:hypothetical protein